MDTSTLTTTSSSRYWHPRHVDPQAKATAIRRLLKLARENLSMDVGYFGTFDGDVQTYHVVDGQGVGPREGATLALDQTLCWQVVTGAMPNTIPDTRREAVTRDLTPVTQQGVGSYLGMPVHHDGELLGMLCLISSRPRPDLSAPDAAMMRLFAQVVALELAPETSEDPEEQRAVQILHEILDGRPDALTVAFQPVARIDAQLQDLALDVRSVEALSRFHVELQRPVEYWFDLAWRHGLGVDLEMLAITRAFDALPQLPETIRLAVNASPETLASSRLRDAIPKDQAHRITVELTEHVLLDDYESLRPGLERVRETGVTLAIDDLGTGSSNLQQVIELAPELIKVDLSITDGVETDPRRRALVAALVTFARDTGISLVTEGIERLATARELDRLGVAYGQGFWLSRAVPVTDLPQLRRFTP